MTIYLAFFLLSSLGLGLAVSVAKIPYDATELFVNWALGTLGFILLGCVAIPMLLYLMSPDKPAPKISGGPALEKALEEPRINKPLEGTSLVAEGLNFGSTKFE